MFWLLNTELQEEVWATAESRTEASITALTILTAGHQVQIVKSVFENEKNFAQLTSLINYIKFQALSNAETMPKIEFKRNQMLNTFWFGDSLKHQSGTINNTCCRRFKDSW